VTTASPPVTSFIANIQSGTAHRPVHRHLR
jgi:hypothetical protein